MRDVDVARPPCASLRKEGDVEMTRKGVRVEERGTTEEELLPRALPTS